MKDIDDLVASDVLSSEGEQGQVSCSLDGYSQPALMLGACACLASASDLATISQIATQSSHVLVVDGF
jgi:hypothetical protein